MSRKCILKNSAIFSLLFLTFPLLVVSQEETRFDPVFFAHLEKQKLHSDQFIYLNSFPDSLLADSMKIKKAELYHFLGNSFGCKAYISSLKLADLSRSSGRSLLGLVLKNNMDSLLIHDKILFHSPAYPNTFKDELKFARLVSTSASQKHFIPFDGPISQENRMEQIQKKYRSYRPPSPVVAGLLSVIPGAGKFYSGNKYQAISAIVINAMLGLQAYESYRKTGPGSFRFIASGSIFAVFYAGNIWGSVIGARKQKSDFIKNLKNEMADFYLPAMNGEFGSLQDLSVMPEPKLIRLEEHAWKSSDISDRNRTYLRRAIVFKEGKNYKKALQELDRIIIYQRDSFSSVVSYEMAMNSFMLNDFTKVIFLMERDSSFYIDEGRRMLYLSSLIENNEWSKVKKIMMASAECTDTLFCRTIKQLDTVSADKNPFLCRKLSSFVPGLGQMVAGYPVKGLTALSIHAALGVWMVYNLTAGFYITAAVSGLAPLIKFYAGNKRLSFRLAEKHNETNKRIIKEHYYKALSVFFPAPG